MIEALNQAWAGGLVAGVAGAILVLVGGHLDRQHSRKQQLIDRGFDIKYDKYSAYIDSIEALLRAIHSYQERGSEPQDHGADPDEIPSDTLRAVRGLRPFASPQLRAKVTEQLQILPSALSLDQRGIDALYACQDEVFALVQKDLGLSDRRWNRK